MSNTESVAYLGPKASYTHQAALDTFPDRMLLPQSSIEDVFIAVQTRTSSIGVVPFENSTNGPVFFTLDLFADRDRCFPEVEVWGEAFVDVHHCLLGRIKPGQRDRGVASFTSRASTPSTSGTTTPTTQTPLPKQPLTKPLHNISHLTKLYSHPQAWGQCNAFLSAYLRQTERQDCSSTSKAADTVSKEIDADDGEAAIACELAAKVYGLDILARGIEDERGNRTRFLILRNKADGGASLGPSSLSSAQQGAAIFKTLVSFTVPHASPGALAESLSVFGKHGLNLTSISSRPSGMAAWHYVFFVEVLGTSQNGRQGEGAIEHALQDLGKVASYWRCFGTWQAREHGVDVDGQTTMY